MPAPISEATRQAIRDAHAAGASRNQIAKQLGISPGTVTKLCKAEGLTFPAIDTPGFLDSAAATVKQRTIAAHERHLTILERGQQRLLGHYDGKGWPTKLRGINGTEHIEHLPEMLADDWRNAESALASAASTVRNLAPVDNTGRDAAISVVEALVTAVGLPRTETTEQE